MEIHLYDCYDTERISVDISNELKNRIENLVKNDIYYYADKLSVNPARLYDYFIYKTVPIPLDILIGISRIFGLLLIDVEKSITMYKQMFVPIKNSVKNPNLPIEIHPYLTSIIANLFFDGSVPDDGKGTCYNQKNKEIMNDFIKRLEFVFGDVHHSIKLDHMGVCSGGLHPGLVQKLIKIMGKNIIIQAGGGIHWNPRGTKYGAMGLRQAVDAIMERIPLKEYAKTHLELKEALDKFGYK